MQCVSERRIVTCGEGPGNMRRPQCRDAAIGMPKFRPSTVARQPGSGQPRESTWASSPASGWSDHGAADRTARSPMASPAPAAAKGPSWPSATQGERFTRAHRRVCRARVRQRTWPSTATWATTRRSRRCSRGLGESLAGVRRLRALDRLTRRARPSAATSWTACRARPSASRSTSRRTASRRWPRPRCRGLRSRQPRC